MVAFLNNHFSVTDDAMRRAIAVRRKYKTEDDDSAQNMLQNAYLLDLSAHKATPKRAQFTYENPKHLHLYSRLLGTHRATQQARQNVIRAAKLIDDMERKVVWAEFINWIADGVYNCIHQRERMEANILKSDMDVQEQMFVLLNNVSDTTSTTSSSTSSFVAPEGVSAGEEYFAAETSPTPTSFISDFKSIAKGGVKCLDLKRLYEKLK